LVSEIRLFTRVSVAKAKSVVAHPDEPADPDSVEETTGVQPRRFSKRLQRFSEDLLETMAEQLGYPWEDVGLVILEGAIDPNVGRHALTERVAHGSVDPNLTNDGELATIRPG
jgi:hypothetical protein